MTQTLSPDINSNITSLLIKCSDGDQSALNELFPFVYQELHRLARSYMRRENRHHTLQTAALVNEAYLRLIDQKSVRWQNRAHFFGIAAQMMRRILVDHARSHHNLKRGGANQRVQLDEAANFAKETAVEMLALDEALQRLALMDERRARVVELRFFGGLSVEETAEVLHVSPITVARDWSIAKAWLYREISGEDASTMESTAREAATSATSTELSTLAK